jgi:GDP/UDP-N,N'-diacetylbacillosamine 2-epimerase (hydrolysing)
MKRKICFITGTRAEYGLLRQLILSTSKDKSLISQIIVTGSHLSRDHGLTYKEIEADGLVITNKVNLKIKSDSSQEIINSMSEGLKGFSKALSILKPDLVIILGDRYEIFAAASTAMILNIPIAHIHGGETTEGAYDEAMRHSITKMSHLHFVAAPEYQKRVHQLGENSKNIFLVGGLGVDAMHSLSLLNKGDLEKSLNYKFGKKNLLITLHPETLEKKQTSKDQINELLSALEEVKDTKFIFTLPNADTNNRKITKMIEKFHAEHPSVSMVFPSLGQLRFLSTLKFIDGIVGNSSSGLTEAPSFKIGTINLGDRQTGRLKAKSVIDSNFEKKNILKSIKTLYTKSFQRNLSSVVNPYGNPGASKKILKTIKEISLENILKKKFYDL